MPPSPFDSILPPPASVGAPKPAVLLFGGTFDPVHHGHTELAFAARDRLFPSGGGPEGWLVIVPAAISPHKAARPTPAHHRVEMLRLACRGRSRWWIWNEELSRAERADADAPSYWVDTLETAAKNHHDLSFLIGADQALAFNRWHEWGRILELARPVVIARDEARDADSLKSAMLERGWPASDADRFLARARLVQTPLMDVSATAIREQLAANAPGPINGLDREVERYARRLGLYRA